MCNLSNLESKVGELDVRKIESTPVHLRKLINRVKIVSLKKTECDDLVKNVNTINNTDTINLVEKTDYNTKISKIEQEITDHDHSNKYFTTK